MKEKTDLELDRERIAELGGVTIVAQMLGFAVARVGNWHKRGVPARVKLDFPAYFLNPRKAKKAKE